MCRDSLYFKLIENTPRSASLKSSAMIGINPKPERIEDRISGINQPIAVAAIRWLVELGQSKKTVWFGRSRLIGKVTEQLLSIVNRAVSIPI